MSNDVSLPREKCMKCQEESKKLLSSLAVFFNKITDPCDHKFCQSCFRKENADLTTSETYRFTCPCCHTLFYESTHSIDEAIILGEAATMRMYIKPQLIQGRDVVQTSDEKSSFLHEMNKLLIKQLEELLKFNPSDFDL